MISWVIFIIHLVSSFMMIGIVWLVQVINYPLLSLVPEQFFSAYYRSHLLKSQWIIVPLMVLEAATGGLLLIFPIVQVAYWLYQINFALIVLIWLETILMHLSVHRQLKERHSKAAIENLTRIGWLRTITWSAHGAVLIAILY